jgi:hypothetical protein
MTASREERERIYEDLQEECARVRKARRARVRCADRLCGADDCPACHPEIAAREGWREDGVTLGRAHRVPGIACCRSIRRRDRAHAGRAARAVLRAKIARAGEARE